MVCVAVMLCGVLADNEEMTLPPELARKYAMFLQDVDALSQQQYSDKDGVVQIDDF